MREQSYRVLLVCDQWFGSTGWAVAECIRRLGHEVLTVNYREIIPKVTTFRLKVVRRILLPWFVRDFNQYILQQRDNFQPDILFVVKGAYVQAQTLRMFRDSGTKTYNFYPDVSAFTHDKYIPEMLPEYDRIFSTKSFHLKDFKERLGIEKVSYVPHGYDPDVHIPLILTDADKKCYETDVSFIGMHSPKKERLAASIHRACPDAGIKIWGNLWNERCNSPELAPFIMNKPLWGWAYSKAIQGGRINLGVNSEAVPGASSGDLMSRRSFEIPACGGFMIHERNAEVQSFYDEDKEVVLFDSPEELAEKARHYLDNEDQRQAIAKAGFDRCVPAYSYEERMRECLRLMDEAN